MVKGLSQNFGYQDKEGIFLYVEELLFLLETVRQYIVHDLNKKKIFMKIFTYILQVPVNAFLLHLSIQFFSVL